MFLKIEIQPLYFMMVMKEVQSHMCGTYYQMNHLPDPSLNDEKIKI